MKKHERELDAGLWIIAFICFLAPIIESGIICNDEVMLRLWRQQGIGSFFYNTIMKENLSKGRVLAIIGNLKVLGYLGDSKYVFRTIQCMFLFAGIVLFGVFIHRATENKKVSLLTCLLIIAFMPITFEPSVPDAFLIVCLQPLICLLISLIQYIDYLKERKRSQIIWSMIFYLWAMFLYEFIITYSLLFLIIYVGKKENNRISFWDALSCVFPVFAVSVIYLILYVFQGILFQTTYSGNSIGEISVSAIWQTMWPLFLSAVPGFYVFMSDKYLYLHNIYHLDGVDWLAFIYIIVLAINIWKVLRKDDQNKDVIAKNRILTIASAYIYCFLPALPNAITPMYQKAIPQGQFSSIPVSIYLFFAMVFGISFVICMVVERYRRSWVNAIIIAACLFLSLNIQIRNHSISNVHSQDYARFTNIEDIFEMQYWKQYGDMQIFAPSVYQPRNALAIEKGHWTEYSQIFGNQISVIDEPSKENRSQGYLDMIDDEQFYFESGDRYYLIARMARNMGEHIALKNSSGLLSIYEVNNAIWHENNYYVQPISPICDGDDTNVSIADI